MSYLAEEQRMPRLFAWVVWLVLTATAVNAASAFLLSGSSPSRLPHAPFFLVAQLVSDDVPLGEDVAVPGKGERNVWDCEQHSKYMLAAVHACDLVSLFSPRMRAPRLTPAPVLMPVRVWFPRKLSPPSASDEPFLS